MLDRQQKKSHDVGLVLIARQTSGRLPNKVLMDVGGVPMVERILEKALINVTSYTFAIPDNTQNEGLRNFLESRSYKVFCGAEEDVLSRFIGAAQCLDTDYIQRLNCDNLLFDPAYMQTCYASIRGEHDIYTNIHCSNHSGSSVEIIKKDHCLIRKVPSMYEMEHVFPYFYANDELSVSNLPCPSEKVFPIDTLADLQSARELFP